MISIVHRSPVGGGYRSLGLSLWPMIQNHSLRRARKPLRGAADLQHRMSRSMSCKGTGMDGGVPFMCRTSGGIFPSAEQLPETQDADGPTCHSSVRTSRYHYHVITNKLSCRLITPTSTFNGLEPNPSLHLSQERIASSSTTSMTPLGPRPWHRSLFVPRPSPP